MGCGNLELCQSLTLIYTHTHSHTHTHTYTHTHTHTHSHIHAHTQTMQTDLVSPLIKAAEKGHTEVVVKLLRAGAKLNHQNKVRSVWY